VAVKRYVILAEGGFGEHDAKTATGVLRYGRSEVAAVIDSTRAGTTVRDHIRGLESDVPVVARLEDALPLDPDTLLVGLAPAGGHLPPAWRETLLRAAAAGLDLESGLHDFLGDDPDLVEAAAAAGVELRDLRRAPAHLDVPSGENLTVDARVVLTVGSDCALGKMSASLELDAAARARGLQSVFVATGQTGIAIAGWGIAVDEVVSDFVAGASEQLVLEGHRRGGDRALLWVEGQGSINHPAYSGVTLGLLHGSAPHALVLVHDPARPGIDGDPRWPLPPLPELVTDYERLARYVRPAPVAAIALKTNLLGERKAREAMRATEEETGLVADDPVRFGADRLLDAVLARLGD
jgi:uncharacterized NAD-dependent epimerase/dehydratase family protein